MKVKRQNNNNNSDYNPGEIYESAVKIMTNSRKL